jgi:hypothetical protein
MTKRPSRQMSFRIEPELAKKVEEAAAFEELKVADFTRKLFRRAFEDYETAGSLHALRAAENDGATKSKKKAS